jgi:HAD superfamily hydrolase (TIGR01549 family)
MGGAEINPSSVDVLMLITIKRRKTTSPAKTAQSHRIGRSSIPIHARCILFDLDGTLYDSPTYSKRLEEEITRVVSEELGIDKRQTKLLLAEKRKVIGTLTRTIETLGIDRRLFYRRIAEGIDPQAYLSPNAEVRETLERLKGMGFRIGLVSNSGRELVAKLLDAIGVEDEIFDTIVTSTDSEPKPSPAPFLLATHNLRCEIVDAVYVGDREEAEIRPARQLGLKTVLLTSDKKVTSRWADAVVNSISQLPDMLTVR